MDDLSYLRFDADFSAPHIVRAYDEVSLWSALFGLFLLDEVPLDAQTVLDVGCGTGFPLIELAERLGPAAHVHGIDPWSAGLVRAREKIADRGTLNVTVHEGSATAMNFPDAMFDLIVSNLGINNFSDRAGAMRECRRVSRTGAVLALTTNLQGHMQELYDAFGQTLENLGDQDGLRRLAAHVGERATVASVTELMSGTGFAVRRVALRSATMRFRDGRALFHHHFIQLGFLDAWKRIPSDQERAFTALQRRLDELAHERGELRLTIPMAYLEGVAG